MKLLMHLRRVLICLLLPVLVSCGAKPDFENRYAADAGDILRAETYTETVEEIPTEPVFAPSVMEQKNFPALEEPDAVLSEPEDIIVLPVVVPEPETEPTIVAPTTETEPPVVAPEPETAASVAVPAPETPVTVVTADPIPAVVTFVCNTNSGKYHLPDCGSVAKIKEENIAYLTCGESEIPAGFAPCSVCLAASAALLKAQIPAADPGTVSYILNTNTMKFHAPICKSVNKIKAENYAEFSGTRDEAIASGYSPCGNCKP
ncbi:MAG: hypothetical protein IJB52_05460 [Clostridia bacterium]|nr:hypothetical protein [Clostridia bacterium]